MSFAVRCISQSNKVLVIAGDNSHSEPYSENLKKQASEHILFVGFVDGKEKEELLSNAYCYVLPSTFEAMPLSLLEAMSFGNCIVASDLPELKAVLKNEGILFRTGNAHDLKDKLSFALGNTEYTNRQGAKMIYYVKCHHNLNFIFLNYKEIINDLLKES